MTGMYTWINIKDKQPECEQDVIWLYRGVAVQGWTGPHSDCIKKWNGEEAYLDESGITHWIPMPRIP